MDKHAPLYVAFQGKTLTIRSLNEAEDLMTRLRVVIERRRTEPELPPKQFTTLSLDHGYLHKEEILALMLQHEPYPSVAKAHATRLYSSLCRYGLNPRSRRFLMRCILCGRSSKEVCSFRGQRGWRFGRPHSQTHIGSLTLHGNSLRMLSSEEFKGTVQGVGDVMAADFRLLKVHLPPLSTERK